jgi:hypothetical protein
MQIAKYKIRNTYNINYKTKGTQTPENNQQRTGFTLHHLLKMEPTQCSETSAFNTQTPGKYPEDNLSLQHGESLKTRKNWITEILS